MAVKNNRLKLPIAIKQRGQSMVEFAFLVPILVGMIYFLVQSNIVVNSGIVNLKYTRNRMFYLFFNNRYYPRSGFLNRADGSFMTRFWIGMDERPGEDRGNESPRALTIKIGHGRPPPEDETPGLVSRRQNVRIRITSFVCTPPLGTTGSRYLSENNMPDNFYGMGQPRFCAL